MTDTEPATSQVPAGPPTPTGPPKRPWWVKAFIILAVLATLFVVLSLAGVLPGGPGRHGPGRHVSGSGSPAQSAPVLDPFTARR